MFGPVNHAGTRSTADATSRYHRLCRSPLHSVCLAVRRKTRKDFLGSRGASPCRLLRRFQNRKPQEGFLLLAAHRTSTARLSTTRSFKKTARCTSAEISSPISLSSQVRRSLLKDLSKEKSSTKAA